MLVNIDATDISALSQQFGKLVKELLAVIHIAATPQTVQSSPIGNFRGFDSKQFYVIRQGSIAARYQGKTIYTLEPGDILLPDIVGDLDHDIAVVYSSDTGAQVDSYPALNFLQQVFDEPAAIRLWTRLLITYAGLVLRIAAYNAKDEAPATPGFEVYQPGDTIIRQGDLADYVYNMNAGVAEVLMNNVSVGRIGEGEIFGAMAVLTGAARSATVKAKETCSVTKVPREQFAELIKIHPATIHSLLIDMANSIVNLNEQLVGLQAASEKDRPDG